jgi:hypothetical protein
MENTSHTPDTALLDLATADQLTAVRRNQAQRLLDMAEALLQNLEAIELPKDAVGIDRTAKAILSVTKTLNDLHEVAGGMAKQAAVKDSMAADPEVEIEARMTAMQIYRAAQGIRLQAQALKRAHKPDEGAAEAASARPHWP